LTKTHNKTRVVREMVREMVRENRTTWAEEHRNEQEASYQQEYHNVEPVVVVVMVGDEKDEEDEAVPEVADPGFVESVEEDPRLGLGSEKKPDSHEAKLQ
jgi:hypothetical protein